MERKKRPHKLGTMAFYEKRQASFQKKVRETGKGDSMSTQKAREALEKANRRLDLDNFGSWGTHIKSDVKIALAALTEQEARVKALVEASDFYKQAVEATFEEDEEIQEIGVLDCCGDEDCAHCAYISAKERFAAALEAFKEDSKKEMEDL